MGDALLVLACDLIAASAGFFLGCAVTDYRRDREQWAREDEEERS